MRVLVIEDNALVAFDVADMLTRAGFEVVGPATTLDEGIGLIESDFPDGAILDIDMGRTSTTFEVARDLLTKNKSVIFLSGYSEDMRPLPEDLRSVPRLTKPYDRFEVMEEFARLIPG